MPQLIEQWSTKSADGIAIGFITIWFMGDLLNLIGAVWAQLLPEVIFLAVWFCIADALMIGLYFYYTKVYPKHHKHHLHGHGNRTGSRGSHASGEGSPLLRRRSSTLTDIAILPEAHSFLTKYVVPLFLVAAAGVLGYFFGGSSQHEDAPSSKIAVGPQIVGYLSAFLYLGARIPQIIQNHKRRSVEGLSLLFFMLSTLGNLMYAGQILFYKSDAKYILLNLSWLLGSLGTIFEDSIIFVQFYIYRSHSIVDAD